MRPWAAAPVCWPPACAAWPARRGPSGGAPPAWASLRGWAGPAHRRSCASAGQAAEAGQRRSISAPSQAHVLVQLQSRIGCMCGPAQRSRWWACSRYPGRMHSVRQLLQAVVGGAAHLLSWSSCSACTGSRCSSPRNAGRSRMSSAKMHPSAHRSCAQPSSGWWTQIGEPAGAHTGQPEMDGRGCHDGVGRKANGHEAAVLVAGPRQRAFILWGHQVGRACRTRAALQGRLHSRPAQVCRSLRGPLAGCWPGGCKGAGCAAGGTEYRRWGGRTTAVV